MTFFAGDTFSRPEWYKVRTEAVKTMIARRPSLLVLGVLAFLTWPGCQPAVQPPVENQEPHATVQKKGGSKAMRSELDEDSFRVRLLMVETVQKELGLTADQVEKLRDFAKTSEARSQEYLTKSREILPSSRSFPPDEFETRRRKLQALSDDLKTEGKELRTKTLTMLTPSQSERLKQIQLQATIPAALARPEIIKALEISEEQCAKIRSLRDAMDQKQLAEWPDLRDLNPKERRQKLIEFMKRSNEAQAEATNRILDLLTPEQRTKFEKLEGNKIDVTHIYDTLIPEDAEF